MQISTCAACVGARGWGRWGHRFSGFPVPAGSLGAMPPVRPRLPPSSRYQHPEAPPASEPAPPVAPVRVKPGPALQRCKQPRVHDADLSDGAGLRKKEELGRQAPDMGGHGLPTDILAVRAGGPGCEGKAVRTIFPRGRGFSRVRDGSTAALPLLRPQHIPPRWVGQGRHGL